MPFILRSLWLCKWRKHQDVRTTVLLAYPNTGYSEAEAKSLAQILKTISERKPGVAYEDMYSVRCQSSVYKTYLLLKTTSWSLCMGVGFLSQHTQPPWNLKSPGLSNQTSQRGRVKTKYKERGFLRGSFGYLGLHCPWRTARWTPLFGEAKGHILSF